MKLVATRKFKYGTRHLVAGDEFEAPHLHGWLLVGARKAREAEPEIRPSIDYAPDGAPIVSELGALRNRAELLGIKIDKRWGAKRLQEEIGKAQ